MNHQSKAFISHVGQPDFHPQAAGCQSFARCAKTSAYEFATRGFPTATRAKSCFELGENLPPGKVLGMVSVPCEKVVLGKQAGEFCQGICAHCAKTKFPGGGTERLRRARCAVGSLIVVTPKEAAQPPNPAAIAAWRAQAAKGRCKDIASVHGPATYHSSEGDRALTMDLDVLTRVDRSFSPRLTNVFADCEMVFG